MNCRLVKTLSRIALRDTLHLRYRFVANPLCCIIAHFRPLCEVIEKNAKLPLFLAVCHYIFRMLQNG
jgi:hypothetical protein